MGDFIYDLLSTVFYPAEKVMDWGMNQHPVIGFSAVMLTAAAYVGVLIAPLKA